MSKISSRWLLLAWPHWALPTAAYAQMGLEQYQHEQFCEAEMVENAAPGRATILYLDAVRILREHGAVKVSDRESSEGEYEASLREEADEYRDSDWYLQLEGKLKSSLLPSETLSTVLILPNSARGKEISVQCWPGYTEEQYRAIDDMGLFATIFSADPRDHLENQRILFFSDIRVAVAKAVAEAEVSRSQKALEYVRALSQDEDRLAKMYLDKSLRVIRVIAYGDFLERSDIGSIEDANKPEDMAREAVKRFGYSARGTHFHMYGVATDEAGEKTREFWDEFFHTARGYLASFGPDLSLNGDMPEMFQTVDTEILLGDPPGPRGATLNLAASGSGDLLDSSIVVANYFRSRIIGTFTCDKPSEPCRSTCRIEAEIQRPVVLEAGDRKEKLRMSGEGGELIGSIGVEGPQGVNMIEVEGGFAECL